MPKNDPGDVAVRAIAKFSHDGQPVRPGDLLRVALADAADLVAVRMVEATESPDGLPRARDTYARRDMRAKS